VTPHLPPEQSANAILPLQLGRALSADGVSASYLSHPSTRGPVRDLPGPVTLTAKRGGGWLARTPLGAALAAGGMGRVAKTAIGSADVVNLHSNGFLIEVAGRTAARLGVPAVVTLYGTDVWEHDPARHRRFRGVVRAAAARVFYSRALQAFAAPLGLADPPSRVIYAPVDDVFRAPDEDARTALRRDLGIAGRRVVLTVKRLHPVAGYDVALRAIATVVREMPDVLWVVAGYGALQSEIDADVQRQGLARHVRVLGLTPQAELPRWYAAADVFLLASRLESWGAVTLEALASGTPVVATATAGSSEVHGLLPDDVRLVPVGDADGLARETLAILRQPRRTTAATARRIDADLRTGAAAAAYLDVYRAAARAR
jgi:glycosyltransferase involved in cell wall biosynthesis